MDTVTSKTGVRERCRELRERGERIAFVPTMGNLHDGHLKLVRHGRSIAERVVVSIFVNPMQFGPQEDYAVYPRTLEADRTALMQEDADLLFVPAVEEIYAGDLAATTRVEVPGLDTILCGAFRPGFFTGIATVVTRLCNLVQPDIAIFGEKDYQQLVVIRRLAADLCMPVVIEGVATVREADGLAMSSRNSYLDSRERAIAPELYRVLCAVRTELLTGLTPYAELERLAMSQLTAAGFKPDYVSIRRSVDLGEPEAGDRPLRVLAAAWLGSARLIDNIEISAG